MFLQLIGMLVQKRETARNFQRNFFSIYAK